MEVPIFDLTGSLSGANTWTGLLELMLELVEEMTKAALWTRHECRICCNGVNFGGQTVPIRAVVCDGITAVRFARCRVKFCREQLSSRKGAR